MGKIILRIMCKKLTKKYAIMFIQFCITFSSYSQSQFNTHSHSEIDRMLIDNISLKSHFAYGKNEILNSFSCYNSLFKIENSAMYPNILFIDNLTLHSNQISCDNPTTSQINHPSELYPFYNSKYNFYPRTIKWNFNYGTLYKEEYRTIWGVFWNLVGKAAFAGFFYGAATINIDEHPEANYVIFGFLAISLGARYGLAPLYLD